MLGKFLVAFAASIADIHAKVGNRFRPQHNHRSDSRDRMVYRLTSSNRVRNLEGGTPTFRERYQLLIYGDMQADADGLGQLFLDHLDGYSGTLAGVECMNAQVVDASDQEDVEPDDLDPKPCRVLELAIWYRAA